MDSSGNTFLISTKTESPPTPESKIPTGALFTVLDFPLQLITEGPGRMAHAFIPYAGSSPPAVAMDLRSSLDLGPFVWPACRWRRVHPEHAQVRIAVLQPRARPRGVHRIRPARLCWRAASQIRTRRPDLAEIKLAWCRVASADLAGRSLVVGWHSVAQQTRRGRARPLLVYLHARLARSRCSHRSHRVDSSRRHDEPFRLDACRD